MQWRRFHRFARVLVLCVSGALMSCANRGIGPQGGPVDSIPPVVVKESPQNGTLLFQGNRIEIQFDEYIQLDNVVENVLVSPPQQVPPEVKAVGKKLSFVFQEPLRDSTTYTIDFGNAICDYTEKNVMHGYSYSFATGDKMDSLMLSGVVYNAEDLNPVKGVVVGIHSVTDDSVFAKQPFVRIAKTDSAGRFAIRNIRQGTYRLYALQDVSRDYLYQPGEGVAFTDSLYTPVMQTTVNYDTVWKTTDSVRTLDTVLIHTQTTYVPEDVVLCFFQEQKTKHYLQRVKRDAAHLFQLIFSAPQSELPIVRPLPLSVVDTTRNDTALAPWQDWSPYIQWQVSAKQDTMVCWLTDSIAIQQDSLAMEVRYLKSDSLFQLSMACDTVMAVWRAPRLSAQLMEARAKKEQDRKLKLSSNASGKFEVFDTLLIRADVPVTTLAKEKIQLYQKRDTVFALLDYMLVPCDSSGMAYWVVYPYEAQKQYELSVDSAAFVDIYGKANEKVKFQLTVKSKEEYSSVRIRLTDYVEGARLQLLNEKDVVVRDLPVDKEQGTLFENVPPASYYVRMYWDENSDGRWTTGDWLLHRQPEPVFYFPSKLTLRANWDFEETFDWRKTPQLESKPQEIRKVHS